MTTAEFKRIIPRKTGFLAAVVAILLAVGTSLAVHDNGVFELDGNAFDGTGAGAPDDWDRLDDGVGDPSGDDSALASVFITDPITRDDEIFTQGGSKDDLDIKAGGVAGATVGPWLHTTGSVPDKDDIEHAFAAAYSCPDGSDVGSAVDLCLYFGLDRYARNGDAQVGFWFLKEDLNAEADGTFSDPHSLGDVLILSDFTNGGAVSTIRVFKWVGIGGDTNDSLENVANEVACSAAIAGDIACAQANTSVVASPWFYDPKTGPNNSFPLGSFFEGGVNLNSLGLDIGCGGSFLAETRSSQSVDAQLKDFALGDFSLCTANIQVGQDGTNRVNTPHPVTGHVNVVVNGVSQNVPNGTQIDFSIESGPGTLSAPSCTTSGGTGSCTVTLDSAVGGVTVVHATSDFNFGGTPFHVETNGQGSNSDDLQKTWVDARVGIVGNDTNSIYEPHTFTVTLQKDTGTGTFVAANGEDVDVTLTNGGGAAYVVNAATSTCDVVGGPDHTNPDTAGSGQCIVNFTSNSTGTVTGDATASLTVGGVPITVTTDDTNSQAPGPVVKTFLDGSVRWLKHDQDGNPLGGAEFELCRTHRLNSGGGTYAAEPGGPSCVTFVDNDPPDSDPDAGEIEVIDLILGSYTVEETNPPLGYHIGATPGAGPFSFPNMTISDGDVELSVIFVNERAFRIIVITCDDTLDELVDGSVTLDPGGSLESTLPTITAAQLAALGWLESDGVTPVSQASFCGQPGASFGDLDPGTYALDVLVPS